MVDFLLVHDAGQGSWCWGKVWGHLTAPAEHPPRLYASGNVGKVVAMDLPGHGPRGEGNPRHILTTSVKEDRSSLSLEDFVSAVASQVQSQGLHDLVMAGHGVAAPILLQAAAKLEDPPRRIVLFAGLIPGEGESPLGDASPATQAGIQDDGQAQRRPQEGIQASRSGDTPRLLQWHGAL